MMAASLQKDDVWAQGTVLEVVKPLVKILGNIILLRFSNTASLHVSIVLGKSQCLFLFLCSDISLTSVMVNEMDLGQLPCSFNIVLFDVSLTEIS